jgi:hypothetical protein
MKKSTRFEPEGETQGGNSTKERHIHGFVGAPKVADAVGEINRNHAHFYSGGNTDVQFQGGQELWRNQKVWCHLRTEDQRPNPAEMFHTPEKSELTKVEEYLHRHVYQESGGGIRVWKEDEKVWAKIILRWNNPKRTGLLARKALRDLGIPIGAGSKTTELTDVMDKLRELVGLKDPEQNKEEHRKQTPSEQKPEPWPDHTLEWQI